MDSIWTEGVSLPQFQPLEADIKTDVLIIGGGIAGLLCAHFLEENHVDYVLLEGRTICSGVTNKTNAKITAQHGFIYHSLLERVGAEQASIYLQANQDAVRTYAELCKGIDCDYETKPAYVYSVNNRKKLENEVDALARLGFHSKIVETEELPFPTAGAVCFERQAQFHPLKFLSNITPTLRIYEHSFVREFKENTAVTDKGRVTFKKAIFATHFPIDNKHGMYFLKMYQHRSYVIALEHAADVKGMYVDEAMDGLSFRNYGNALFVGGGGHRTGKKGGNWEVLRQFARQYYPSAKEIACWATQDCISLDQIPYIGPYSKSLPNCYVATGFHKWGMTTSMVAAKILTDLVQEKENPYSEVFTPSRSMLKYQLLINGCEAMKSWLTFTSKRCPHLGCALKWNRAEHSWDCPCHGSRFDADGTLLDNPATGNIKP